MDNSSRKDLIRCLQIILRPLVKFCLKHSIKLQDLVEVCKVVLLQLAEEQLDSSKEPVSASRLAVMTGVHRRDVKRLQDTSDSKKITLDIATKVIGQWSNHPDFVTKKKQPKIITYEGADSEFSDLVHSVSRDLNPYTILFELERIGAVKKTEKGLKLTAEMYMPKGFEEGMVILGDDIEDLIESVNENITSSYDIPHLHIRTRYDNIHPDGIPEIKRWFIEEGSIFHERAREFLSQFDRDVNQNLSKEGASVSACLSAFSRVICKNQGENNVQIQ